MIGSSFSPKRLSIFISYNKIRARKLREKREREMSARLLAVEVQKGRRRRLVEDAKRGHHHHQSSNDDDDAILSPPQNNNVL